MKDVIATKRIFCVHSECGTLLFGSLKMAKVRLQTCLINKRKKTL